ARGQTFENMLEISHAAGSDHGDPDALGYGAGKLDVVAVFCSVPVHAGQKDFARAVAGHPLRPLAGVDTGRLSSAVRKHFPAAVFPLGVDSDDDALAAESLRRLANEFRTRDCAGVDRNF